MEIHEYNMLINIVNGEYSLVIDLNNYKSDEELLIDIVNIMYTNNTKIIHNSNLFTIYANSYIPLKPIDYGIIKYNTGNTPFPHYQKYELESELRNCWENIKLYLDCYKEKFWSEDFRNICHK